ncbi:hypothetical protein PMIN06_009448 [Paraphaeosphaeria minitans]
MNGRQNSQQTPHTQIGSNPPACSVQARSPHIVDTENKISVASLACSETAYNVAAVSLTTPSAALERIKISQHRTISQTWVTVVAVAGTRGLKDWVVNLKNSASEPDGILGGQRTMCHAGFLEAVRILIRPIARSLSAVEDGSTLLFTGHSAGAAIASLLYSHLKSTKNSPLAQTAAGFDTIHRIIFGAPPISTIPLPVHADERSDSRSSLFLSLINDGDPITKADMGYIANRWLKHFRHHSPLIRRSWDNHALDPGSGVAATPSRRMFANSGTLLSMRVEPARKSQISIRVVDNKELDEERVTTWKVHGIKIYRKRIAALLAAGEPIDYRRKDRQARISHTVTSRGEIHREEMMLNGARISRLNRGYSITVSSTSAGFISAGNSLVEPSMSSLFRLPRELRDEVYLAVLYDADGLLYKKDKDGIARLCRRSAHQSSRKSILASLRRAFPGRAFPRSRAHRSEANQLKYVCKQLYKETKGLALPQNRIILEDSRSLNAMGQCIPLFRRWSMLRNVAIKCFSMTFESDCGKTMLIAILNYCMENVDVCVRVHIPYWSQADPNFVPRGLSYLSALRKETTLIKRLAQETSISYLLDDESKQIKMDVQVPPNLRWAPKEEEFNLSLFGRNARRHPWLSSPSARAVIEVLKELAEGWVVNGL